MDKHKRYFWRRILEGTMGNETWTGVKKSERPVRGLLDKEDQIELAAMERFKVENDREKKD